MSETYPKPAARGVTYEQVAAAADALLAGNQKLSVRNVREALGGTGSLATISRHLAAFDAQRPKTHAADIEMSSGIRREIEAEILRHVTEATSALHEQLANVVNDRDAVVAEAEAQAAALAEAEQQLATLRATTTEQAARLEELRTAEERERTAAEQARVSLAEANLRVQSIPGLEAELERLRTALDVRTADLSAATATVSGLTAERDSLLKQLAGVEQRASVTEAHLERLQGELLTERERTGKAEARVAAADARVEATAARITDLQEQLKAAAARESDAARRAEARVDELQEQLKATAARESDATRRAEAAEQRAQVAVQKGVREQK
jgi:colicin import membrane protein